MNIDNNSAARVLHMLAAWALCAVAALAAPQALAQKASTDSKPKAAAAAAATPAASSASAALPTVPGTKYSEKGADTCLYCHDEESDTATFTNAAVFKSRHANRADAHGPFGKGGLQCEACHGPGANHSIKDSKKLPTTNSQKANSFMTAEQRNEPCLGCHQNQPRNAWHVGAHERNQVACADCHKVHADRDPVLVRQTQADVCYRCHKQQRADFLKTSSHPVAQGKMACSDCHSGHGSTTAASLNRPTLNQTCTACHAEKRGPVLWEHAPVAEDCGLCHAAHGTVRAALLNKSTPVLCQQCHSVAGHPAVARTGASLPGGSAGGQGFLLAGSCSNCHSQVHGSNHPSGSKLMR